MKEVVIMSYSHRTFTVLLLGLASCWLFALVEAQKSPPQCNMVGQIRVGNPLYNNESCIVNLTNIEVCESDGWRVLCDTDLSERDAQVICRELGYSDIGAAAGKFRQLVGGFLTTKFPVCNGNEQRLSECEQLDRSGAVCVEKLFVTCFLSGTDATMCGISTELPSTTSDESTMRQASSTSSAPLHPTTQVVDLPKATSTRESHGVTSTKELGTSQQTQRNTLPSYITISIGACVGLIVVVILVIILCVIVFMVCYKRTRREKNNNQVSPDSPVKVQKSHETDGKDLESGTYSELNNTVLQHQVPIYESVNKSQNLSEVSATESNDDHHTYAELDPKAIYSQISPHLGPSKSSTLPAGLSGREPSEPSLYYEKLDHSLSLPRSMAPPTSSSGIGCNVPHAVNRTALALESGKINETDLASPTQSDSSVRYPSPRGSPKQCLSSSAKYPSPRGSPKQYPSSQSSTASKEEAPLIRGHSTNPTVMQNYYHVLVPEATPSGVIDHEKERYDNDSQASTDAVCNQQMSENCQPHSHINCELGVTLGGAMEDGNRHLYAILDPSPDAQYSPPSHHNTRQRSQSALNNRSPPQQQKMHSHGRQAATGHGLSYSYSGHRAVAPNKYSQSQFHSSSAEFSNDPQMNTLV